MTDKIHDLAIIGAGPGGLTAALYAGRFRMDTLLLERLSPGGQILLSPSIENYPGFPGGVSTEELIAKFKEQVKEAGIEAKSCEVAGIKQDKDSFTLSTSEGPVKARSIIIASGAMPKRLDIKGEDKFIGRGVSYCGTCDGPLFKGKEICVVGGGDRAIEDAIFLAGYASKIYLIHRRNEFRASRILVEKIKDNPKIEFVLESVAEEIIGENKVEAIRVKNVKSGQAREIPCQGVFIFVGILPNTGFAKNLLDTDEFGFIITDQEMRTSCFGIFACGDCRKKALYQVVSACGEGAVAADSAYKYLLNRPK